MNGKRRLLAVLILAQALPALAVKMVINVQVEDMNNNTMPDLILCYGDDKGLEILLQDPLRSGSFPLAAMTQPTGTGNWLQAVTADFGSPTGTIDGRVDLAAVSDAMGVKVWFQNATGFSFVEQSTNLPNSGSFRSLAAADVNADGTPDLLFCSDSAALANADRLQVWQGDRRGTWSRRAIAGSELPTDAKFTSLLVADVNLDGVKDMLVGNNKGDGNAATGIFVYNGNGNGTFNVAYTSGLGAPIPLPASQGKSTNSLLLADVNLDGRQDILQATPGGFGVNSGIKVYQVNPGLTTWTLVATAGDASTNHTRVEAGDYDRDGKVDLVASSDTLAAPGLLLFAHTGTAQSFTFTAAQQLATGLNKSMRLVDLNEDGTLDVVGTDPDPVAGTGTAKTAWNHKHDIANPPDGATVYEVDGRPNFYFNSLTNLEAGLKYRVEISTTSNFNSPARVLDLVSNTGDWYGATSFAPFQQAKVRPKAAGAPLLEAPLADGTWYWRVLTFARGRYSPSSKPRVFTLSTTLDTVPPRPVTNLKASKVDPPAGNTINFTWDATTLDIYGNPETCASYRLYLSAVPTGPWNGTTLIKVFTGCPTSGNYGPSAVPPDPTAPEGYYQMLVEDLAGNVSAP